MAVYAGVARDVQKLIFIRVAALVEPSKPRSIPSDACRDAFASKIGSLVGFVVTSAQRGTSRRTPKYRKCLKSFSFEPLGSRRAEAILSPLETHLYRKRNLSASIYTKRNPESTDTPIAVGLRRPRAGGSGRGCRNSEAHCGESSIHKRLASRAGMRLQRPAGAVRFRDCPIRRISLTALKEWKTTAHNGPAWILPSISCGWLG